MSAFLDESKNSEPIQPPIPINFAIKIIQSAEEDKKFFSFLMTIMSDLPEYKKKFLRGTIINMALRQIFF